jgi:hypothetical protein
MDERKLSELLRDAVADAPPPSFDQHDVARESARQVRRRNGLLTGSALALALLAGTTALGVALWTGARSAEQPTAADSDAASGNANAAPYELPNEEERGVPPTERQQSSPPESRKQGRTSDGEAGPSGPGSTSSGCEQADRELAAALAGELPAAAKLRSSDAVPLPTGCPSGSTGAAFNLPDGLLSVLLLGPDATAPAVAADLAAQATASTANGSTVVVTSAPAVPGQEPPYADELDRLAEAVAAAAR